MSKVGFFYDVGLPRLLEQWTTERDVFHAYCEAVSKGLSVRMTRLAQVAMIQMGVTSVSMDVGGLRWVSSSPQPPLSQRVAHPVVRHLLTRDQILRLDTRSTANFDQVEYDMIFLLTHSSVSTACFLRHSSSRGVSHCPYESGATGDDAFTEFWKSDIVDLFANSARQHDHKIPVIVFVGCSPGSDAPDLLTDRDLVAAAMKRCTCAGIVDRMLMSPLSSWGERVEIDRAMSIQGFLCEDAWGFNLVADDLSLSLTFGPMDDKSSLVSLRESAKWGLFAVILALSSRDGGEDVAIGLGYLHDVFQGRRCPAAGDDEVCVPDVFGDRSAFCHSWLLSGGFDAICDLRQYVPTRRVFSFLFPDLPADSPLHDAVRFSDLGIEGEELRDPNPPLASFDDIEIVPSAVYGDGDDSDGGSDIVFY